MQAKEFLSNLKNWDFEFLGKYKIDENEARELIRIMEEYKKLKEIQKEMKRIEKE